MKKVKKSTLPVYTPPNVVIDQQNKVITINGKRLENTTHLNIKVVDCYSPSEVTLTFPAKVTVIPPDKYE